MGPLSHYIHRLKKYCMIHVKSEVQLLVCATQEKMRVGQLEI